MLRAAIASKKLEIIAVNDPFLSTDYMVSINHILHFDPKGAEVTVDTLILLM